MSDDEHVSVAQAIHRLKKMHGLALFDMVKRKLLKRIRDE
jgi:hypothetical protein